MNPGHGLDRPPARRQAQHIVSPGMDEPIEPYYIRIWETWCLERGTSRETCSKYASYLKKPLDKNNRWSAKAFKLYFKWRCELGDQVACEEYKKLKTPQARADLRVPSLEQVIDSIRRAGLYRPVYLILLESGLRLVEVAGLLRNYHDLECVELDGFYRCLLGRERGMKRSLWAYHISRPEPMKITDRHVTSYAKKYNLTPPKYVRKFVATRMAELGIPPHIIDFIQGRVPRSVLLQSYAQLLGVADKHYRVYASWLRSLYNSLRV